MDLRASRIAASCFTALIVLWTPNSITVLIRAVQESPSRLDQIYQPIQHNCTPMQIVLTVTYHLTASVV
jgi:hypothetical protein